MSKRVGDKLKWMINFRDNLRDHALVRKNYLDAAALDEQIRGIEAVYEALNGTGALDFELYKDSKNEERLI
jgi:hypothetical protein